MKKLVFLYILICLSLGVDAQGPGVTFASTDAALVTAFNRAKEMALSYKGKPGDPVGKWYESALPPRSAFCMRDVSHQSIGGEILGLNQENKNMLTHFVDNISESKDWCSYWEINHLGQPAPEDYRNDKEFWYNLNANFDVLNASWQLYLWTGDEAYIKDANFEYFQEKSVTDFISRWALQVDSLLKRPTHPNAPVPFNDQDSFHRCRGLPSYSEGVPNIKMGVDLVAALYRGLMSYSEILRVKGQNKAAAIYEQKAIAYQKSIDAFWWNDSSSRYNTYYSTDHKFGIDEGETFLLWFDALKDNTRKEKTIQHLLSNKWNVENLSYFPLIMYQNGHADKGYNYLLKLTDPATQRREYPEVSFGVIKGFVEGLMGLSPDARINRLTTFYRGKSGATAEIKDVPVLKSIITVKHEGSKKSTLTNKGTKEILWKAEFSGDQRVFLNNKPVKIKREKDTSGKIITTAETKVKPGSTVSFSVQQI